MPIHNDYFRTQAHKRTLYRRLCDGSYGDFFDTLKTVNSTITPLFPRLEAILKLKKKDIYKTSIPLCMNYANTYIRFLKSFIMPTGVPFTHNNTAADLAFEQYYRHHKLDMILEKQLSEMIITGISILKIVPYNNTFLHQQMPAETLQPVISSVYGVLQDAYIFESEHSIDDTNTPYTLSERYTIHDNKTLIEYNIYNKSDKKSASTTHNHLLPKLLKPYYDGHKSHYEYNYNPLLVLHNIYEDRYGYGISSFQDVLSLLQALSLLKSIALLELQAHFLSKMAIPQSGLNYGVQTLGEGDYNPLRTKENTDPQFYVFSDEGEIPRYIQKDNSFFTPLYELIRILEDDISIILGVPTSFFSKPTNDIQTIPETRKQPFITMITSYQDKLSEAVNDIAYKWSKMTNSTIPHLYYHFHTPFSTNKYNKNKPSEVWNKETDD